MAGQAGQRDPRRAEKRGAEALRRMREEIARMHFGVSPQERFATLRSNLVRLTLVKGKEKSHLDVNNFYHALQQMGLPLDNAAEAFRALDTEGTNRVNIDYFVGTMLDGPPALGPGCPVTRSPHAKQHVDPSGRAGYPGKGPLSNHPDLARSVGEETNFLGSRGIMRERRTEDHLRSVGTSGVTRDIGPQKSCGLSSSVHLHNQHSKTDNISVSDMVVDAFRKAIIRRGGSNGIHTLARIFRVTEDAERQLSLADLKNGLKDYGVTVEDKCLRLIVGASDRRGTGSVSFAEFLSALRGPVSSARRRVIAEAFRTLDKTGDGVATLKDMQVTFNAKHYPDVVSGRIHEDLAFENWLAQFDTIERDGMVTSDEFSKYYKNVSAAIDDDGYFESMMRGLWRLKK